MEKIIFKIVIIGAIVGIIAGLLFLIPAIDNAVPDKFESVIIGAISGCFAVLLINKKKTT